MKIKGRPLKLKKEQVADIRSYLGAHRWSGAKAAMCRKYNVSHQTISLVLKGQYGSRESSI